MPNPNLKKRDTDQRRWTATDITLRHMSSEKPAQTFEQMFDLPPRHSLKLSSSRKLKRDGMLIETRWLDEHDDKKKLVARFRTWTNRSLSPPYRSQVGWERFSLCGKMLDREVRYSRRQNMQYLH